MAKIAGILFDMDGILIDSEPFWREAEIELFATVDVHLSEAECIETTGLRIDEVVAIRHAQKPWAQPPCSEIADRIVLRVIDLVKEKGRPLPGAREALHHAKASGLPVGLASSSTSQLIEATLEALDLKGFFSVIHSAEGEEFGKPHPAVYLTAARKLGVAATACLAIEDSLNGVISAKAARMTVLAIPDPHGASDPRFVLADRCLGSLAEFPAVLDQLL